MKFTDLYESKKDGQVVKNPLTPRNPVARAAQTVAKGSGAHKNKAKAGLRDQKHKKATVEETQLSDLSRKLSKTVTHKLVENEERDPKTIAKEIKELEKVSSHMAAAVNRVREITKEIKYDDVALDIIVRVQGVIDDSMGISEHDFEILQNDVHQAINNLESAVYKLDEVFVDKHKQLEWKIDDLQSELDEIEYQAQNRDATI